MGSLSILAAGEQESRGVRHLDDSCRAPRSQRLAGTSFHSASTGLPSGPLTSSRLVSPGKADKQAVTSIGQRHLGGRPAGPARPTGGRGGRLGGVSRAAELVRCCDEMAHPMLFRLHREPDRPWKLMATSFKKRSMFSRFSLDVPPRVSSETTNSSRPISTYRAMYLANLCRSADDAGHCRDFGSPGSQLFGVVAHVAREPGPSAESRQGRGRCRGSVARGPRSCGRSVRVVPSSSIHPRTRRRCASSPSRRLRR